MMRRSKQRPGTWVRLSDTIGDDDKVLALLDERGGLEAAAVYMFALAWSGRHGRDGILPRGVLPRIHATKRHADLLVRHGLWERGQDGGWLIPRWDTWQDTTAERAASRVAKAEAGAKRACQRWHQQPCQTCNPVENVVQLLTGEVTP